MLVSSMRNTRFLVAALGLSTFVLGAPARGFAASDVKAERPPAHAAPPAAATPTAAHLALARDVVINSGIATSFQILIPQYLDQIGASFTRTRPELSADLNLVLADMKLEFDKKAEDMIGTAALLYSQRLSQKELEEIAAFYKSAAGRKYVGSQPILMSDMFVALQGWAQKISVEMMTRVREEMRKKGHEL